MFLNTYIKQKPREITYRDYKNFDQNKFKEQLRRSLSDNKTSTYFDFERIFLQILDTHAPLKKKIVRANQAPFVTKTLRKAIMRRSEFESKSTIITQQRKITQPTGNKKIIAVDFIKRNAKSTMKI